MERVALKSIAALTLNGDGSKPNDQLVFVLGAEYVQFSLHVVPKGTGTATLAGIDYYAVDDFYPLAGFSPLALTTKSDNVVTKTDSVSQIRLRFSNAGSPPDAGISVELFASRRLG